MIGDSCLLYYNTRQESLLLHIGIMMRECAMIRRVFQTPPSSKIRFLNPPPLSQEEEFMRHFELLRLQPLTLLNPPPLEEGVPKGRGSSNHWLKFVFIKNVACSYLNIEF